jgi:hypothetical protein
MNFSLDRSVIDLMTGMAIGYLPGVIIGGIIWFSCRRTRTMPLFYADLISFAVPVIVWMVMHASHWTLANTIHREANELAILGWIWSLCVIGRLVIPCCTHKLRFRLAAIHVGSVCVIAAVLLALFYR